MRDIVQRLADDDRPSAIALGSLLRRRHGAAAITWTLAVDVGFGQLGDASEVHEGDGGGTSASWDHRQRCLPITPATYHLPRPHVRTTIIAVFVGLILPAAADAAMPCGQANPDTTRAILEQGQYAHGANPTHTRYEAGLPTITEHTDHTCTATFPLYTWDDAPAGTLTLQLTIVYLACVPDPANLAARCTTVPPGTPGACPFIYLKGYPEV